MVSAYARYQSIVLICLSLLMLHGCGSNGVVRARRTKKSDEVVYQWREYQAKYYDIPMPIGVQTGDVYTDQDSDAVQLHYTISEKLDNLFNFYVQEFERQGWRVLSKSIHYEALVVVEKPSRICTVSLRPYKNGLSVFMVIQNKKRELR